VYIFFFFFFWVSCWRFLVHSVLPLDIDFFILQVIFFYPQLCVTGRSLTAVIVFWLHFVLCYVRLCMLLQVRVASAPRLEMWLQNPKVMRPAQELLMSVCVNCSSHTQRDVEVISHLVKIRLKTKALINLYLSCIRYSDLVLKETPHRLHTG